MKRRIITTSTQTSLEHWTKATTLMIRSWLYYALAGRAAISAPGFAGLSLVPSRRCLRLSGYPDLFLMLCRGSLDRSGSSHCPVRTGALPILPGECLLGCYASRPLWVISLSQVESGLNPDCSFAHLPRLNRTETE